MTRLLYLGITIAIISDKYGIGLLAGKTWHSQGRIRRACMSIQISNGAISDRRMNFDLLSATVDDLVIDRVVQPLSDWLELRISVNCHKLKRLCYFFALLALGFSISKYYRHNEAIFFVVLASWLAGYYFLVLLPQLYPKYDPVNLSFVKGNGFFMPLNVNRFRQKTFRNLLMLIILLSAAASFSNNCAYLSCPICLLFLWAGSCVNSCLLVKRKEFIAPSRNNSR